MPNFVILSEAKNLSFFSSAETEERFFASLRMTKRESLARDVEEKSTVQHYDLTGSRDIHPPLAPDRSIKPAEDHAIDDVPEQGDQSHHRHHQIDVIQIAASH